LAGGKAGSPGKASVIRNRGSIEETPGWFCTRRRHSGRITIETLGGGGGA